MTDNIKKDRLSKAAQTILAQNKTTSLDTLVSLADVPCVTFTGDDSEKVIGNIAIARYGLDGYRLHVVEPHLGMMKYKPILRRSMSEQAYLVSLVNFTAKAVLRRALRGKNRLRSKDPQELLAWLLARKMEAETALEAAGVTSALDEVKSSARRLSRVVNIMTIRSAAFRNQDAAWKVKMAQAGAQDVSPDPDDLWEEDDAVSDEGENTQAANEQNNRTKSKGWKVGISSSHSASELFTKKIGRPQHLMRGPARSVAREEQISEFEAMFRDRAKRGLFPVDPHRISSEVRPLLPDGSMSASLRTVLQNLKEGMNPRLSTNAAGRTEASRAKTLQSLAAGTAKLHSKEYYEKRYTPAAQEEYAGTLNSIAGAHLLARPPSERSAYKVSVGNTLYERVGTCPRCKILIYKTGHPAQQHYCPADKSFYVFNSVECPQLQRIIHLHDSLSELPSQEPFLSFARHAVSITHFEPVREALLRHKERFPEGERDSFALMTDLVFVSKIEDAGTREATLLFHATDLFLQRRAQDPAIASLQRAKQVDIVKETAATMEILRHLCRPKSDTILISTGLKAGRKALKQEVSILDVRMRMARCADANCAIKYHQIVLPNTTPTHHCSGGGRNAPKSVSIHGDSSDFSASSDPFLRHRAR